MSTFWRRPNVSPIDSWRMHRKAAEEHCLHSLLARLLIPASQHQLTCPQLHTCPFNRYTATPTDRLRKLSLRGSVFDWMDHNPPHARWLIPTSRYLNPPNSQVPPLANRFRNQASTAQPLVGCTTAIFIFKQAPPAPRLPCLRHQSIPYNRFDVPFATVIGPLANAQSTSLAPQTRPTSAKQQIIMLLRPSTSGLAGKLQLVYPPQV